MSDPLSECAALPRQEGGREDMRSCSIVLIALPMLACSGESGEPGHGQAKAPVQSSFASEFETEEQIRLVTAQQGFRSLLQAGNDLEIVVANDRESAGVLTVHHWIAVEGDSVRGSFSPLAVAADTTATIRLPVSELALPTRALDYSGDLVLYGSMQYDDRPDRFETPTLRLHFHAASGGWEIYDTEARDRDFDEGALTAKARSDRAILRAAALPRARLRVTGNVRVEKVSESATVNPPLEED